MLQHFLARVKWTEEANFRVFHFVQQCRMRFLCIHSFLHVVEHRKFIYIKKIKNTELAREKQAKFSIKRIHIIFMSLVQCDNKNFPLSISLTPRSSCTLFYDNELNFVDSLDNSLLPLLLLHPFLWRRLRRRRLH